MWYLILIVISVMNSAIISEIQEEEGTSNSTMELIALAQCEALCYECAPEHNITSSQCMDQCNGSDACSDSCSCRRELHENAEVRRTILQENCPSSPWLHCRGITMLIVKWECQVGQPVFVLEMRNKVDNIWQPSNKTGHKMMTFYDLKNGTMYQFRVRAISPKGQLGKPATSDWISTLNYSFKPKPIIDIEIGNVTLEANHASLQTTLTWKPAWDRTCFYEVVLWDINTVKTKEVTEPEEFEHILNDLEFGTNYVVDIRGRSQDKTQESNITSLEFSTPLCLEFYYHDLTKCVPPKPGNISVDEDPLIHIGNATQLYNVTVSWQPPLLEPTLHEVTLFRLEPEYLFLAQENVTGNSTTSTFISLALGSRYEITLQAFSPAGFSEVTTLIRTIAEHHANTTPTYAMNTTWNKGPLVLYILMLLSLLLTAAVLSLCLYRRHVKRIRHKRRFKYIETWDHKSSTRTEISTVMPFDLEPDAEWEIPREKLLLGEVLGEGAFGIVRKGALQEGDSWRDVAVKMLRDEPTTEDLRQFKQEINVMKSVGQHPNIVSLIGCCTSSGLIRLVVEYCAQGDLLNFLRKNWNDTAKPADQRRSLSYKNDCAKMCRHFKYSELLKETGTGAGENVNQLPRVVVNQMYNFINGDEDSPQTLTPLDLLSFIRQIAVGMEHLSNNRVVHRDLAARNVLVCADQTIKISDFGLSRDIYEENVYRKKGSGRLPVKWMALESLLYQVYTTQSDVWSYGVLLWEIVTLGGNPYPGIPTNKLFSLLREGYRMDCPTNCSKEIYDIMLACWQANPKNRPTFAELHKTIDNLLENSSPQKYVNLNMMNYKSEFNSLSEESMSRNTGGYLHSNLNQVSRASPSLTEDTQYYLASPIERKGIKTKNISQRFKEKLGKELNFL